MTQSESFALSNVTSFHNQVQGLCDTFHSNLVNIFQEAEKKNSEKEIVDIVEKANNCQTILIPNGDYLAQFSQDVYNIMKSLQGIRHMKKYFENERKTTTSSCNDYVKEEKLKLQQDLSEKRKTITDFYAIQTQELRRKYNST